MTEVCGEHGWSSAVTRAGRVTYFLITGLSAPYVRPVQQAVDWFNNTVNCGLTLEPAATPAAANLLFEVKAGEGRDQLIEFEGNKVHFSGKLCSGQTMPSCTRDDHVKVFLPPQPIIQKGGHNHKLAGARVRTILVEHELVHVAGLSDDDHTRSPPWDVFASGSRNTDGLESNWEIWPGKGHEEDTLTVGGTPITPDMDLSPATKAKLRAIWG